jgi:GNAT superfamily N-acetyltransferase
VERICAHTFDWGDYIPEVWDDWLADERALVIVGELEAEPPPYGRRPRGGREGGLVVALSKITFQTPDQLWLAGMRVEPDYRRQGIAGRFLDYSLVHARERGARVIRLGTGSHNIPVHKMVARVGMERVATYVLWTAEALPDGPVLTFLSPVHTAQVRAFLDDSLVLAHVQGLYSFDWAWQELSAERVSEFLEGGQMAAGFAPDGRLATLAPIRFDPNDGTLWLGFADGESAAVAALARGLRGHATRIGADKVRVMLPDVDWLRAAFRAAGYGFGDWEGELWIFERRLES